MPVYLDGDSESAQKLGERFKVRGYPTMILFRPDGTEVTRLPGEVDPARYMQALTLGMNAAHPFKETLASALKDGARLKRDEWRMLADYSWDTDGDLPVASERIAQTLQTLASPCRRGPRAGGVAAARIKGARRRRCRRTEAERCIRYGSGVHGGVRGIEGPDA